MPTEVQIKSWTNHHESKFVRQLDEGTVISAETKPSGASSCWLEVGQLTTKTNRLGRKVSMWTPTKDRYPNKDSRLYCERTYGGKSGGNSERQYWEILVPNGFPDVILMNNGGGHFGKVWPLPEEE